MRQAETDATPRASRMLLLHVGGQLARLRKANAELRRANAILKDASIYFALELLTDPWVLRTARERRPQAADGEHGEGDQGLGRVEAVGAAADQA